MKSKILFLIIPVLVLVSLTTKICLAEVKISDMPTPEKIQNFIPRPLSDFFKMLSNVKIDFSKLPFVNRIVAAIPKSGEEVANEFQWLTVRLGNINYWAQSHIGLNIILIIKKIGEFFVWIFQGIANLIKIGLSFVH